MNLLLDTNILSEMRKGPQAHPSVQAWHDASQNVEKFTSAIVIAELRRGARAKARRDPAAGIHLDRWIARVINNFQDRILPVNLAVAEAWAALMVPNPRSPMDALIAATALANGLTLVTRNIRDFSGTGIALLDPWSFKPS